MRKLKSSSQILIILLILSLFSCQSKTYVGKQSEGQWNDKTYNMLEDICGHKIDSVFGANSLPYRYNYQDVESTKDYLILRLNDRKTLLNSLKNSGHNLSSELIISEHIGRNDRYTAEIITKNNKIYLFNKEKNIVFLEQSVDRFEEDFNLIGYDSNCHLKYTDVPTHIDILTHFDDSEPSIKVLRVAMTSQFRK